MSKKWKSVAVSSLFAPLLFDKLPRETPALRYPRISISQERGFLRTLSVVLSSPSFLSLCTVFVPPSGGVVVFAKGERERRDALIFCHHAISTTSCISIASPSSLSLSLTCRRRQSRPRWRGRREVYEMRQPHPGQVQGT